MSLCFILSIGQVLSFLPPHILFSPGSLGAEFQTLRADFRSLRAESAPDNNDEPKLFPIPKGLKGYSSPKPAIPPTINVSKPSNKVPIAFVGSPKIQLQYTCKRCGHTSRHSITRLAYTEGIVICQCKGCNAKHLIADNLGWYNFLPEGGTIEDYLESREETFTRVGVDVWEMEKVLHSTSGSGPRFWTSDEVQKWMDESGFGSAVRSNFDGKCGSELIDLAAMGKTGEPLLDEIILGLLQESNDAE